MKNIKTKKEDIEQWLSLLNGKPTSTSNALKKMKPRLSDFDAFMLSIEKESDVNKIADIENNFISLINNKDDYKVNSGDVKVILQSNILSDEFKNKIFSTKHFTWHRFNILKKIASECFSAGDFEDLSLAIKLFSFNVTSSIDKWAVSGFIKSNDGGKASGEFLDNFSGDLYLTFYNEIEKNKNNIANLFSKNNKLKDLLIDVENNFFNIHEGMAAHVNSNKKDAMYYNLKSLMLKCRAASSEIYSKCLFRYSIESGDAKAIDYVLSKSKNFKVDKFYKAAGDDDDCYFSGWAFSSDSDACLYWSDAKFVKGVINILSKCNKETLNYIEKSVTASALEYHKYFNTDCFKDVGVDVDSIKFEKEIKQLNLMELMLYLSTDWFEYCYKNKDIKPIIKNYLEKSSSIAKLIELQRGSPIRRSDISSRDYNNRIEMILSHKHFQAGYISLIIEDIMENLTASHYPYQSGSRNDTLLKFVSNVIKDCSDESFNVISDFADKNKYNLNENVLSQLSSLILSRVTVNPNYNQRTKRKM